MRRTHLRGHHNILKRLLVHASGFNLGLLMRQWCGRGTPRGLQGRRGAAPWGPCRSLSRLHQTLDDYTRAFRAVTTPDAPPAPLFGVGARMTSGPTSATG